MFPFFLVIVSVCHCNIVCGLSEYNQALMVSIDHTWLPWGFYIIVCTTGDKAMKLSLCDPNIVLFDNYMYMVHALLCFVKFYPYPTGLLHIF